MAFGRLERPAAGATPMSEINVTPLVDVMLVLVVIFIITAPLLASAIRLDLPNTEGAKPIDEPQFVSIAVDRAGQVFLQDQPITLEQLGTRLKAAAGQNPGTEVQLRADQAVPYGRIVEVMGVAQGAGLNRIGFVAEPKAATPGAK